MTRLLPLLSAIVVMTVFGAAIVIYPDLPQMVPIHWGANGRIDGWAPKGFGTFILPLTMLSLLALQILLPLFSKKLEGVESRRAFDIILTSVVLFMAAVSGAQLTASLGRPAPMSEVIITGIGLLWIIIGFAIADTKPNPYVGIRLPWTMKSEEVWTRTHRFARWCFVIGGLIVLIAGWAGMNLLVPIVCALAAAFLPGFYAFAIGRRLAGR